MRKTAISFIVLLASACALAEGTRTWEQSKFEEFQKGTTRGVAIRSNGSLELAPAFKALYTTPSTYIWSVASDAQGNAYVAAGSPARVYRITPSGQASVILEPQELQVQALVVDGNGDIYAATSPDGKIYRVQHKTPEKSTQTLPLQEQAENDSNRDKFKVGLDPSFASSVFYEPKTKYIWDLALDSEGRLYVATGDQGEIFRVLRNGQGSLFFKSDEAHIRVLAFDSKGNLIAGSDGSGLVYRITPAGEAFVLYSAAKKEITALAIDPAGNIYAAGAGEKRTGTSILSSGLGVPQRQPQQSLGGQPQSFPMSAGMAPIGSEIYQIAPDGSPKRIWSSRDDIVYALGFDQHGRLLAGTGNGGHVFSIDGPGEFTDLLKASATQVTGFAKAPNGGLYVSSSNLGKLFVLSATPNAEGSYESDVFDAHNFSRWGRLEVRGTGDFDLFARSGNVDNPDRNWSPWKHVDLARNLPVDVPSARFVQWKAVIRPSTRSARIDSVLLNYLPKNVAPQIDEITVQVGSRFQSSPRLIGDSNSGNVARNDSPLSTRDRGSIAVRWGTRDDNDDELVYSLYYRGERETRWKLLKDNLADKFYSFDASLLPDGGYTVKVIASDAPSHSPEESLYAEKESARFEVDNTPPQVQELNAAVEADTLHITFRALDGYSNVKHAEYSVDAGEWQFVEPIGQLSDYRVENYDLSVPLPGVPPENGAPKAPAAAKAKKTPATNAAEGLGEPTPQFIEHLVVVRVYDRFENMGTAKVVVRGVK